MKNPSALLSFLFLFAICAIQVVMVVAYDEPLCTSPTNTFTARVNLHAGELGYYVFEECGLDVLNPSIAMELGQTYTFVQEHRSNYFHPIGFAYSPYGDEEIKLEVEPVTTRGLTDCVETASCDAPMYHRQGQYLGKYSNTESIANRTTHQEDFGLDVYEPLFFRSPAEWTEFGPFTITFTLTDETLITNDMFYFCHIHEFMGGRIKVTKNRQVQNQLDIPSLGYTYDYDTPALSDFDKECGTFGLGDFQLPNNPYCPDRFVCGTDPTVDADLHRFAQCIDAMNCHMMAGMSTGTKAQSRAALFVHQMIPHHQNAVNMAKALLKAEELKCDDLTNEDDHDCVLEGILYEIVNTQNLQIQAMYDYLDAKRYKEADNCEVFVETLDQPPGTESGATPIHGRWTMAVVSAVFVWNAVVAHLSGGCSETQ